MSDALSAVPEPADGYAEELPEDPAEILQKELRSSFMAASGVMYYARELSNLVRDDNPSDAELRSLSSRLGGCVVLHVVSRQKAFDAAKVLGKDPREVVTMSWADAARYAIDWVPGSTNPPEPEIIARTKKSPMERDPQSVAALGLGLIEESSSPQGRTAAGVAAAIRDAVLEAGLSSRDLGEVEDRLAPAAEASEVDQLVRIGLAAARVSLARAELDEAVQSARNSGVRWSHVATAAGLSQSAAQRRWDAEARRKHTEYERQRKRDARG